MSPNASPAPSAAAVQAIVWSGIGRRLACGDARRGMARPCRGGASGPHRAAGARRRLLLWRAARSGERRRAGALRARCAMPVCHVGGLSVLVRSAIYATTAVVHEHFEAQPVLDALCGQGITLVSLVATTLARLLDAGLGRPPSLRCVLTGGGPVPAA